MRLHYSLFLGTLFLKPFDEVDTFESYYRNIIYRDNLLILPYINIGLSFHPLNPSKEHLNINKAYIVFIDACVNKINGGLTEYCNKYSFENYKAIKISGTDIEKDRHTELEVFYQRAFLQLLPSSQIRKERWVSIRTPNYKPNMEEKEVASFFSYQEMPENIKALLNHSLRG